MIAFILLSLLVTQNKDSRSEVSFEERRLDRTSEIPIEIVFSPDGNRVAYRLSTGTGEFVVVDGKKSDPFKSAKLLTFSPDGKRFAYVIEQGERTISVVLDGVKGAEY